MARVTIFGNPKGGVGKSTLAVNVAAMHTAEGRNTLLICADKNATAQLWSYKRIECNIAPSVKCVQILGKGLAGQVQTMMDDYEEIVVDCAGHDSYEFRSALTIKRFAPDAIVVAPIGTSEFDLYSLEDLLDIVEDVRAVGVEPTIKVLLNCAPTSASQSVINEARKRIEEAQAFPLMRAVICSRVAFEYSTKTGESVMEYKGKSDSDEKARIEIRKAFKEIYV